MPQRSGALANFLRLIPNAERVLDPDGRPWLAVGHAQPSPDPAAPHMRFMRNAFGDAFLREGREWTLRLCMSDSDGDGLTNGEELGDPRRRLGLQTRASSCRHCPEFFHSHG